MNTMWPKLDEGIAMFPGETKPVCSDSDLSIARGRKAYFGATESDGKNGKPAWWWWWTLSLLCLSLSLSLPPLFFSFSLSLSLSFSSLISVSLFILPLTYLLFESSCGGKGGRAPKERNRTGMVYICGRWRGRGPKLQRASDLGAVAVLCAGVCGSGAAGDGKSFDFN